LKINAVNLVENFTLVSRYQKKITAGLPDQMDCDRLFANI